MKVQIICPLYNAEKYIYKLDKSLMMQKNSKISSIKYILTESVDNTKNILDELSADYSEIKKEEFSHSLVREKYALESDSDIIVFITQDIIIKDKYWLINLIKPILEGKAEATFSRQISKYNNIEKYIREKNYPNKSYIVTKNDVKKLGLRAFFFSDAASAINLNVFKKLNGYDSKNLIISEDMYFAYKLIMNDYRIKYCANSVVYHSHEFTLRELYKRYFNTGIFFKENNFLLQYKANKAGANLALYVFKRIIEDKNWKVLIQFLPNMFVRLFGMKLGKIFGK